MFERGVEVLGGDAEGIWLEKGSQRCVGLQDFPQKKADRNSFQFSILLPATLATHDYHQFGRISYMLTARVEGIPSSSSITHIFRKDAPAISSDIPFKEVWAPSLLDPTSSRRIKRFTVRNHEDLSPRPRGEHR